MNQSISTQIQLDVTESKGMIAEVQLGQILNMSFMTTLPTSGESLQYCQSFERRHRQKRTTTLLPDLSQLETWSRQPQSSFLITQSTSSLAARDFLVRLINLIRSSDHRILWALRFADYWERESTYIDVLRMLFMQALQLNPSALTSPNHPISVTAIREAVCEADWLELLNRALRGIPCAYIVLDADLLNHVTGQSRYETAKLIEAMPRLVSGTVVKVFVSNFMIDEAYVVRNWEPERWTRLRTDEMDLSLNARNRALQQRKKIYKKRKR